MQQAKKIALLEDMLEMDEGSLSADMALSDLESWDSMAKLSLIVLMDEECGKKISGDQIKALSTVQDILDFMD